MPETIPRTIADRYVVDGEVGRGGMVVAYPDWTALRGNQRFEKLLTALNK